ncbi:MAG: phytanoyl-CoA dioxygenase family protein, partial [Acidimicrobiales bacterium]
MGIATVVEPSQRRDFYGENGYLVVPGVLPPEEVTELRAALEEVLG